MIRLTALWLVLLASTVLLLVLREDRLSSEGKIPLGRIRRLWLRKEKRRAPRYRVDWQIRYRRSESQPASDALPRNLSRTGAGLALTEKLPVGSLLQLDVTLPGRPSPVALTGQVVWAREVPPRPGTGQDRQFFVGIHFQNVGPALEQELSDALAGRSPSPSPEWSAPADAQPLPAAGSRPPQSWAARYARQRRCAWLAQVALSLGFLAALIQAGMDHHWALWVRSHLRVWPLQVALYSAGLWGAWTLLSFPLDWAVGFRMEHRYQMSTQRFPQWFADYLKQLALGGALGLVVMEGLSLLLRVSGNGWWFWAAIAWMGWSVLLTRVAPTWLIPIFYQQRPLEEGDLRRRLQGLLERCGTRVHGIFQVNLSRTTRKANACLCGLFRSRRILISDTLLSRYPPEEVEVVLAHELGHHRLHHIGLLLLTNTAAAGISCLLVDRWLRLGLGMTRLEDLSTLPALGLGLSLAGLFGMPIVHGISRRLETQADRFALRQTGNPNAFVAAMRRLAEQNLAELRPPRWVEWLLYDHPPIAKRIAMAEGLGEAHG